MCRNILSMGQGHVQGRGQNGDKMTKGQNNQGTKWPEDKMTRGQNYLGTKWPWTKLPGTKWPGIKRIGKKGPSTKWLGTKQRVIVPNSNPLAICYPQNSLEQKFISRSFVTLVQPKQNKIKSFKFNLFGTLVLAKVKQCHFTWSLRLHYWSVLSLP